ncbi:ribose-phosphate pyrophosphokinase [Halonotius aquaticus]|uniref:ribose-phosphate diphosphokinase n=1 Tax=Halonotius aquaticus TaxID=2216978 RepID=A0A3A6PLC6_9EURY|nr:ribose-phosphate diphosphokinase [Halonotius aquaticus]RJX42187.1 ribose-phosphate pyrophosphokinase [Halonotius aquaticus]
MATIVPAPSSQSVAAALAATGVGTLTTPTYEWFTDDETLLSVPEFDDDAAIVVGSTATNDAHIELLQLQDAVREAGATDITTVIPYLGYARQDQAFKTGQPVSARAMAKAISTGTDRVIVVNPHEPDVTDFFTVPTEAVDAAAALADPLDDLSEPLFVAPDEGATALATTTRDAYGEGEVDYFEKERDYDTGAVEVTPSDATVEGRDVVLVDDIIATGGTMSGAINALHDHDVGRVYACCVHPVLAGAARTKLAAAGVEAVIGTDTIERAVSDVSVAPAIADVLR